MMARLETEEKIRSYEGMADNLEGERDGLTSASASAMSDAMNALDRGSYRDAVTLIQDALTFAVDAFFDDVRAQDWRSKARALRDSLGDGEES